MIQTYLVTITLPGARKGRPVRFTNTASGGMVSDAVVAVRYAPAGESYPLPIRLPDGFGGSAASIGPGELDDPLFRTGLPVIVGWADRPKLRWRDQPHLRWQGEVEITAHPKNWGADHVARALERSDDWGGTILDAESADAIAAAVAVHAFEPCKHPGQHGYGGAPICERCRNSAPDRAHCRHPRAANDHDHDQRERPVCADCGGALDPGICLSDRPGPEFAEMPEWRVPQVRIPEPLGPGRWNTRIEYRYRDASNYHREASVVLPGRISRDDARALCSAIAQASRRAGVDPDCFVPTDLGLPPAQYELWEQLGSAPNEDDHVYNELVAIEATERSADAQMPTPAQVLARAVRARAGGWDVMRAVEALGLEGL